MIKLFRICIDYYNYHDESKATYDYHVNMNELISFTDKNRDCEEINKYRWKGT